MKTKTKVLAGAGTLALATAVAVPTSGLLDHSDKKDTRGAAVTSQVIGGTPDVNPGIVQLIFTQAGEQYGCTGELLNAEWVLTAKHCTHDAEDMNVYFSNSTKDRGPATAADEVANAPFGDVGLVHLSKPHPMKSYVPIIDVSAPRKGQEGIIAGYGLDADNKMPKSLHKSSVAIEGMSTDAFGGLAVHVKGIDGSSNHGDSGGPLIIDGKVVGVCSTGDTADPHGDIHAGSNYANLTLNRFWIKRKAGV